MELSLIIVNWNTRAQLVGALRSAQAASARLEAESIVVDNGSTDGSVELVQREFPQVQLISNEDNLGFTRGCNQGIERAQGRYLLILNADIILAEDCLLKLIRTLEEHPEIGACGPRLGEEETEVAAGIFPRLWLRLLPQGRDARMQGRLMERQFVREDDLLHVDWLIGACLLVRREVIEQVGAMDEHFFMYYEDVDWCLRMHQAGWRCTVVTSAVCVHQFGAATQKADPVAANLRMQMSEYTYWRLHGGRMATLTLYCIRLVRSVTKLAGVWLIWSLATGRRKQLQPLLRLSAARVSFHLRHAGDILWREPKPYRADDYTPSG